ncbi:MAG: hypothetical protein AAF389_15875 [Gemmatimonadota bacterium]
MGRITPHLGLVLALGLLVAAAVRPVRQASSFERTRDAAVGEVQNLRLAVERRWGEYSSWPTPGALGEIPLEVAAAFPGDSILGGDGYRIRWHTVRYVSFSDEPIQDLPPEAIAAVDSIPTSVEEGTAESGLITLHSADPRLLAALLDEFRGDGSFVADSTWSLVVPPPGS